MSDRENPPNLESTGRYVVEVTQNVDKDSHQLVDSVASTFGISQEKARQLLNRMPGAVTKAVPHQMAQRVVSKLAQVGINSVMTPHGTPAEPSKSHSAEHHHHVIADEDDSLETPRPERPSGNAVIYNSEDSESALHAGSRFGIQRRPSLIAVLVIVLLIAVVVTVYLTQ
jgi:hypothetical protein